MGRGNTGLDNYEYDNHLAKTKNERELRSRTIERRTAHKKDGSGWHFGIDDKPVKVKDMAEFRKELDKRGLAIYGEYKGQKK